MAALPERLTDALADRYRIERLLGSGGMADVYLAQDLKHPRRVAIKALKPEIAALLGRERFMREIELVARLQHPYILALWDSGVAGDLLYYVMPWLEGDTLRQRLEREKQLPLEDAVRITGEVSEALDFAHGHGVVHRDIKPENILFEGGHALVADFGIARAVGMAGGPQLTETGVTLGTPAYMSTEQVLGGGELDGRSDQYSLACVAYEMLGGQPPFTGATVENVVHQHVAAQPRPVTDLRPAVSAAVARALARALAKSPADRFPTTVEFARALETGTFHRAAAEAAPAPLPPPWLRRRLVLGVAGLVVAAALTTWWWVDFRGRPAVADPSKKDFILVAQFEGPSDDPGLAPAVRNMIMAGLDQSGIAATVPDADLREALRSAGKPDTTRVDADLARELAYRRSIRAVLEGQVGRLGAGYSISTRLVDVDHDRVFLSTSETAADQHRLIPALQRLGHRLRLALGEKRAALQASRPLYAVATPDFEAYRLFVRGEQATAQRDYEYAARLHRAAIARDPDFGGAWRSLSVALNNQGKLDSALWVAEQALRSADRLSEFDRLSLEGLVALLHRDLPTALDASERTLRASLTPRDLSAALHFRAYALSVAGRYEEACESRQQAAEAFPFPPSESTRNFLFADLARLGRFGEARQVVQPMRAKHEALARLEVFCGRWAEAESIGTIVASNTALPLQTRFSGALSAASGGAAKGRVAQAERLLDGVRRAAISAGNTQLARDCVDAEIELAFYSGRRGTTAITADAEDTTFAGLLSRVFRMNVTSRHDGATAALRRVQADPRSRTPSQALNLALLESWTILAIGRTEEAVAGLRPLALQTEGPFYGLGWELNARQQARWLLAGAYAQQDKPDSALVCLELLLAPVGRYRDLMQRRGFHCSFAHRELVLLYVRVGRLDAARRHWEAFQKAFTDPDPELRPLVDEARLALAAAEAMARPRAQ